MVMSLRSKWAAGKTVRAGLAVGGRLSKLIRNRRATQPPAHFQLNPLARAALAILGRCSLDPYQSKYGPSRAASKIANSATPPLYQPRTWCTSRRSASVGDTRREYCLQDQWDE